MRWNTAREREREPTGAPTDPPTRTLDTEGESETGRGRP